MVKIKNPFRIYEDLDYDQQSSDDDELEEKFAENINNQVEDEEEEDIEGSELDSFMEEDDYKCQQYLEFKPTIILL